MLKNQKIIDQLTLEQKAELTSGASEWQTYGIKGKVPSLFLSDGPFGLRKQSGAGDHLGLNASEPATCFPTTATMANSWNPKVAEEVGEAVAAEARVLDVNQVLGPALNVKRNPRGGRSFEYFSEDPYLAGKMAANLIKGLQKNGTIATPKHFAVNSQETRRMASNSVVDERALREIYLTNFEIAVKEGQPKSIMSSYNRVNGIYANENKHLLSDFLRKDFGFKGYVVTDWGGDNDHVAGIKAGSNLQMPGVGPLAALEVIKAVKEGTLKESTLDKRVDEFLTVAFNSTAGKNKGQKVDWKKQHEIAAKAARESIVLLQNKSNLLPLRENTKVALIGDFAKKPRYQGAGSSIINTKNLENLVDTAKNYPLEVTGYAQGYKRTGEDDPELIKDAKGLAEKSDVVILNVGLDEGSESEGLDRKDLKMPKNQLDLIDALNSVGKPIVVVLSAGSSTELPWTDKVDAIVHSYLGGEAGASATWDVLTGKYNPSGRLSETYPLKEEDIPFNDEFPEENNNALYKESIFVGYRYYDTAKVQVKYPFGFGLSYTKFSFANLRVSEMGIKVDVTNTGEKAGRETVQLYVGKKDSPLIRAARELKGFKQVDLEPGESKTVEIPFDDKTFRYWDVESNSWQHEKGTYQIMVGKNVEDICCEEDFELTDGIVPVIHETPAYDKYRRADIKDITEQDFAELYHATLPVNKPRNKGQELFYDSTLSDMRYGKSWIGRSIANWLEKKINQSLAQGKPDLNFLFNYNMPFRAMSKMTGGLIDSAMAYDIVFLMNGHFWRGSGRLISDYFKNKKELKKASWYQPDLDNEED